MHKKYENFVKWSDNSFLEIFPFNDYFNHSCAFWSCILKSVRDIMKRIFVSLMSNVQVIKLELGLRTIFKTFITFIKYQMISRTKQLVQFADNLRSIISFSIIQRKYTLLWICFRCVFSSPAIWSCNCSISYICS